MHILENAAPYGIWLWPLFADVLNGLLCKGRWKGTMPRVHCYCFMRSNETNADIVKVRLESYYNIALSFRVFIFVIVQEMSLSTFQMMSSLTIR